MLRLLLRKRALPRRPKHETGGAIMTTPANGIGTWTRWVLTAVIVGMMALATAVGRSMAQDATQNVRLDRVERVLDRMDGKLDRLLERSP